MAAPPCPIIPAACQPEPREGVVAAACGDRPVGIDLERWNASQPDHSDLDFALAPAERKRLQSMAASDADADAPSRLPRWPSCGSGCARKCLVKLGRITLDQLDSVDFSAFMQTESVAQAAVTHFAHQACTIPNGSIRNCGSWHGGRRRPFDIHPFRCRCGTAPARGVPGGRAARRRPLAVPVVPHRIEPALRLLLGHAEPQGRIPLAELPDGLADVVALRGFDALHLVEMRGEGRDRRLRRLDIRRAVECVPRRIIGRVRRLGRRPLQPEKAARIHVATIPACATG